MRKKKPSKSPPPLSPNACNTYKNKPPPSACNSLLPNMFSHCYSGGRSRIMHHFSVCQWINVEASLPALKCNKRQSVASLSCRGQHSKSVRCPIRQKVGGRGHAY